MRLIVQRVLKASVTLETNHEVSSIGQGLMVLVGISRNDTKTDAEFCARKLLNMRLFSSEGQPWRLSVKDAQLELLLVSQFTLYGILNGNKPDFHESMKSELSREFYDNFVQLVKEQYQPEKVKEGSFGAMMQVSLVNDGPVTIQLDSRKFQYVENTNNNNKQNAKKERNNNNSNNKKQNNQPQCQEKVDDNIDIKKE